MQKVTYNNIYDILVSIAGNHRQINTFGFGSTWEMATSGTVNYPMLWVVDEGSTIKQGEVGFKYKLIMMDLVQKGKDDSVDVQSDTHQTLCDVIAKLRMGGYNFTLKREETINLETFEEKFDDEVTGWWGDLTLWVDYEYDSCKIPKITASSSTTLLIDTFALSLE